MDRPTTPRAKLDALTSLRALAALAILIHHFVPVYLPEFRSKWLWKTFVREGFSGVTLFFILSGFVLTYNYAEAFRRPTVGRLRDYYVARFARVYPLFLLAFLVMLPLCFGSQPGQPNPLKGPVYNLTLTHAFVADREVYFAFNPPSWSVSVEAFFYLTFPLVVFTFLSCRITTPLRASMLAMVLAITWFSVGCRYTNDPLHHWYCYICPLSRMLDFGIGICCGILFMKAAEQGLPRWGFRTATCLELSAISLVVVAILASPSLPFGIRLGPYYTIPMALLILVLAVNRGMISRWLCCAPLRILGETSYAMYLLHWPIMTAFKNYREALGMGHLSLSKCGLIVTLTTIVVSILVHYTYERPMRSWVRNRLGSRRSSVPRAEAVLAFEPKETESIQRRAA